MASALIELPIIFDYYCDACGEKDGGYGTPMKYYDRKTKEFVCSIYPDHRETADDFFRFNNGILESQPMELQAIIIELLDEMKVMEFDFHKNI